MTRRYRHYTKEFKLSVLNELNVKSMVEVCREHDIHPVMVSRWKREFNQYPEKAFSGKGNICNYEAEIAKRDRIIGQLYMEKELLKKTAERLQELKAEEKIMKHTK
jgi:transposase-like protein